jgi:membrane associated rhomboid family serine protease
MKRRWTENADIALYAVLAVWAAYILNYLVVPLEFNAYGIRPRVMTGLWGILFCPLLHGNLAHIVANTIALFVLLTLSLSFSRRLTLFALLTVLLGGGGVVWLFGDPHSVYVGASGIVFGLIGFLIAIGLFRREWPALVFALVVFIFYGGTLLSLLRMRPGTSWLAHASGLVFGVTAAWFSRMDRT